MSVVIPFSGHVKRLIRELDELYEFGPTDYYGRFSTMEQCYQDFHKAVSGLTAEEISAGLERLRQIDRKRVSPESREIFLIFTASDGQWKNMQHKFERTTL
jgi:hypothetical protein